jgi:hypothetical protein
MKDHSAALKIICFAIADLTFPPPRSNAMNNPFANFDLEESLAGLPGALRQPMVLAVAASTVAHGLAFLVLPVVTNSAESKKLPDRIVGVVELTPEQQAKLPPSMLVSQFPASSTLLPTVPGGKLPLTGLFPGMPNNNIGIPAPKNSIDSLMDSIERDTKISSSNNSYYVPPVSSYTYTPPNNPAPVKTEAEKEKEKAATKEAEILAAQQRIETEREATRRLEAAENKKKNQTPGSGVTVNPDQQPETPAGSTPIAPGAKDLKQLSPAEQAQRTALAATMVYNADSVSAKAQEHRQNGTNQAILNQLADQIKGLPPEQQGEIAMSIVNAAVVDSVPPITPQLPTGLNLDFGKFERPKQVDVIVQVYLSPDGKLLPYSVGEGQIQEGIAVTTTSGNPYLDDQARGFIKEQLAKNPQKGRYQSIKYKVPVIVPPQQAQG